jgi:membrane-bound serine protease (ClpP class)
MPETLCISLLIGGGLLVAAELFIPGGVLGAIGGVMLAIALIMAFSSESFSTQAATWMTAGVVAFVILTAAAWMKYFPMTPIGRGMTISKDLSDASGTDDTLLALAGKSGEAISDLRPAGFARIDGRRVDVVTQGGMIEEGTPIKVIEIEGNRVVVKKLT